MGHKHTKEEILQGAMDAARADGLSQLTFGRLARRLGISDRVVVYYFPTKDELISEVLMVLGIHLQSALADAFKDGSKDYLELTKTAWPILATDENDPVFALFFEANGLAATGREPYRTLVVQLVEGWISWLTGFVAGPANVRRVEAETAITVIDGLMLLRQLAGPEAADRAAARLGVR